MKDKGKEGGPPPTVKANEFMDMLGVSPNTFRKLLKNGDLPKPMPLSSRVRLWSRSVVMAFLQAS